ncbi:hypothetical protein O7632_17285 [Solwaraspora sp. WMMD406]|uniref:hypothetical protein n=1 Tax=Solwaraspora sp. WMMD406 TaxID=3016095 RepID=UPI0024171503|nr:hypothetical protein [Solwaraspora sp. WMMD406]MDG4765840.1 hypothetical protein [Solwaraspora sp. WMMD406]
MFVTLTHVNIRDGNLYLPPRWQRFAIRFIDADLDVLAVTIWILVLILAVVSTYGSTLLS